MNSSLDEVLCDGFSSSNLSTFSGPLRILAHGTGAPMDSDWMNTMVERLVAQGVGVLRFEFPYMQEWRTLGKRRPPNNMTALTTYYTQLVQAVRLLYRGPLWLAGKSMGGRVATMIADSLVAESLPVSGVVCFGYPFHPVKQPDSLRIAHLQTLQVPCVIIQGTRDPFGSQDDVDHYSLSPAVQLHWLVNGDHDFKPRKRSGYTWQQHISTTAEHVARHVFG